MTQQRNREIIRAAPLQGRFRLAARYHIRTLWYQNHQRSHPVLDPLATPVGDVIRQLKGLG